MAKIKELKFQVSITANLGNYESVKIEVGESVDLEPGDNAAKEMARLVKRVKAVANEEAETLRTELGNEKGSSSKKK